MIYYETIWNWWIHSYFILFYSCFNWFLYRVGVSYYDSSIRQLYVLEVWEDGSTDFPLIDLSRRIFVMYFLLFSLGLITAFPPGRNV